MQFDEFVKLVRRRRSVRKFKPDPVPEEYIKEVLEAARWAMSGANGQPWEFIVIDDQGTNNSFSYETFNQPCTWAQVKLLFQE